MSDRAVLDYSRLFGKFVTGIVIIVLFFTIKYDHRFSHITIILKTKMQNTYMLHNELGHLSKSKVRVTESRTFVVKD